MTTAAFAMRRATPSDKEDVVALTRAISEHDFVADIYDWWMTATGPDGFYVAEQDGRIIGCYCLEFPGPGQAYLYAMRIHPEVQGQGIGSRFCRLQVEQARAAGAEDIFLLSVLDNHRAHRTVEKNGFVNQGPWLVYAGLKELPPQPSVRAARPATPADLPDVARFRQETEGGPLAGMIASPDSAWAVRRMTGEDWDVANLVVVPGRNGLFIPRS